MRIGIFTDTYFPQVSGVATSIRVLKEDLERQGHKVIIFTTTDPKVTEPEENIVRLGSIPFFAFKDRRVAIQGLGKAYRIAKENELDIIHTQTEFSLGLAGKLIAAMLKIPTIHTYHTMYEKYLHYVAKGKVLRPSHVAYISKAFCNQTSGVVAPSQMTKDKLIEYGVLQEVRVIPTGVVVPPQEPEVANALRSELGYSDGEVVLLSLSRLSQEKNIAAVIAALPAIVSSKPNVRLCIAGGGPEREKLEAQVAELGMNDFVQFVGEIKNEMVYKYYQMADLYVNASESESQGLTYLEALVNRVPVIAKKNDYLSSLITADALGMLFETDADIADCVLGYIENQLGNEAEVSALQDQLLAEISSETFGERIVDFYEAAINGYQWNQEHSHNIMNLMKFLRLSTNELKDEENEN